MRFLVMAAMLAMVAPVSTQAQTQPSIEDFTREPHMGHARLSPDGLKLAYTSSNEGVPFLIIHNLETGELQVADVSNYRTEGLRWAGNDIILVAASIAQGVPGIVGDVDVGVTISYDLLDNMRPTQLLSRSRATGVNFDTSDIVGVEPETGRVLIPARDNDGNENLLSVDPRADTSRLLAYGRPYTFSWVVGTAGEVIARFDYSSRVDKQLLRVRSGDDWVTIDEDRESRPSYNVHGLLADGRLAVSTTIIQAGSDSRDRLFAMSLETGNFESVIFSHDRFDFNHVIRDRHTNLVVGAAWYENYLEVQWLDEELAGHQRTLDAALDGYHPRIQSWSRDRNLFLVRTDTGDAPPVYYLYNVAENALDGIGLANTALSTGVLSNRFLTEYPARDGTVIQAYLTRPEGEGPFPTVILPHGGPKSRDVGGYNYFAHFFASRGYAVLQPNFRGSSGYGHDWTQAGYGEWGRGVMQDDVTDGVNLLVEAGLSAPDRICIVGASYGGYSALAGATFTPDLYACAAAIAPVSDLQEMYEYTRDRFGFRSWLVTAATELFTGTENNRNARTLRELSPISYVDDITIPILLIHGREDTIVPVEHSRVLNSALRRADVDVEYIEMREGDHWLTSVEMRTTVLTELEQFLDAHIGD